MFRTLLDLVTAPPIRTRFFALILSAIGAVAIGFVAVSPATAETFIQSGGYYYVLGLFVTFLAYAWRVQRERQGVVYAWLGRPGWNAVIILGAAAFAIWSDEFRHKILFDEYVLQGTAYQMHASKEVGTIVRAYNLAGSWQPMYMFLDKRPYFFAFLVSALHDLTGYRLANIFILNAALTPVFLGLVFWVARSIAGRTAAILAVLLLATLPLLGQQSSGAGMELHNLTMIILVMALAILYLRSPTADRLSLLVLGTVLLSQSRYESVIFVAPVAVVIVIGWIRSGRALLPWPVVVAPFLFVPYAWHSRVVDATPGLWQLQENQSARFSLKYLAGNLEGAWKFFFNFGPNLANSWFLSAIGVGALGGTLFFTWRWWRSPNRSPARPDLIVLAAFGAAITADLVLLKFFYYWGRLDDVVASRLALPMCLLFALLAALCAATLDRPRWPVTRVALLGVGIWLLGWGIPAMARSTYTRANLVMQELEWEHEQLVARPGPVLFITNKSTIPFLLWHIPAVINTIGHLRAQQIRFHLREGTWHEVIVSQALRPTSANGDLGVDPRDVMPPQFHLTPITVKRFGGRWIRLSRITSIDPPNPPKSENLAPAISDDGLGTKGAMVGFGLAP